MKFDFENLRCASVLARIGLGYLFAGLIVLNTSVRGQLVWCVGILLGYWGALMWIPVPGIGAGDLSPGNTLADYIDRGLLPGRLYHGVRDPEGIFSTIPAISTALMGALAGHWLRRSDRSGQRKALIVLLAGGLCLAVGQFWNPWFPINKNLWSSSFVLYAGGWSLLFLGIFYLVIDVWGWTRWSFFFVVIGMNAITIYLLGEFIDFRALGEFVFAGSSGSLKKELLPSTGLLLQWLLLYGMYRRKLFLKV
ncbi:unnamed protein product [marine sediment metagenome]|uniref:DUF5009 domain-containing protein n=1 Tax=marine sediment metagenome TaxID=412755 RepID=X0ZJH2_9ZZZZ